MLQLWKQALIGLLAATLAASPAFAYDLGSVEVDQEQITRDPTSGETFVDAVVARPLGLLSMVIGTGAFILSLPFSVTSGSADHAAQVLVQTPTRFTFKRPMGRFASCEDQPELCK